MIDTSRKAIFVHIPKTAGTSFMIALTGKASGRLHFPMRVYNQPSPGVIARGIWQGRYSAIECARILRDRRRYFSQHRDQLDTLKREQFFSFAIVRNPWDRAFSWYRNVLRDPNHRRHHGVEDDISFREFLLNHGDSWALRPQLHWLRSWDQDVGVDYVGRFEDLDNSCGEISERLGIQISSERHNSSGDVVDWREHYDDFTREIVSTRYRDEIEILGYSFE